MSIKIGVISPKYLDSNYGLPFKDQGKVLHFSEPEDTTEYDLIVFPGGPDVTPSLYGEEPHKLTHFDEERDKLLDKIYTIALKNDIPMVGICGGMQFLAVMNGCRLIQHIIGHRNTKHEIIIHETEEIIKVTSDHHQAIGRDEIIDCAGEILANDYPTDIVEAFWFPKTKCLGVQYHPEWMDSSSEGYKYFQKLIKEKCLDYTLHRSSKKQEI